MNDQEIVNADFAWLCCQPWGGEPIEAVTTSLRLYPIGPYGSKIIWSSGNENVITGAGRVIRPKWDEAPASVIMTAKVAQGSVFRKKDFVFTVLPDEPFIDPQYESDESFFKKLSPERQEIKAVIEKSQTGDYQAAKAELLSYYRKRDWKQTRCQKFSPGMTKMMISGMSTLQRCDRYYKGICSVTSLNYKQYRIPLVCEGLTDGMTVTYDLCALYNECMGVTVAGKRAVEKDMRPVLQITDVSGKKYCFDCLDSTAVGAGKNKSISINPGAELPIRLFGNFLGDDTIHCLLKFHIDGMQKEVAEAQLVIYAKKDMDLPGDKEFVILLFSENTWNGEAAKWEDFKWQFANRNGLPEGDVWDWEEGFDFEYLFQRVRFMHFPWVLQEYRKTGDEDILYYLIQTMTSFIKAKGMPRTYCNDHEHIGSGWKDEKTSQTLCAGWPRGLDCAQRLESFSAVLGELVRCRFMNGEIWSAILKYIWDACHALAFQSLTKPVTNLRQFEIIGLLSAAMVFPEFVEQQKWMAIINKTMEQMLFSVTLEDGTYKETTGGYNQAVCENFIRFKIQNIKTLNMMPLEFDERLKRFAFYNVMLQGPDGESLQYGDQGAGKAAGIQYPALIDWSCDEELTYILSKGTQGKKPKWSSYRFCESGVTILRSGWEKDAVYLFTQARGGGSHGHQDDNHITLLAGGKVLLTDAGIFTYSSEDPYRKWGVSPLAHNTVCINDMEQEYYKGAGEYETCIFHKAYDKICQSTKRYRGFFYSREIVYLKPDVFIITDTMVPEESGKINRYRQSWHMLPTANISFDYENHCIYSNFSDGVNLLICSLDEDTQLKKDMGWYDYGYQQLSENPFGYFEKCKAGKTVFHTMLKII